MTEPARPVRHLAGAAGQAPGRLLPLPRAVMNEMQGAQYYVVA
jgi:hypothetical protein